MPRTASASAQTGGSESLEEVVIQRAIAGDERALSRLYDRHASYIAGMVERSLGSDAEVDDVVQETFLQGLSQLASLREASKLRPFLVTIAVRRIYARLNARKRVSSLVHQLLPIAPRASQPEDVDPAHALWDALARVRPDYRVAWVLHRVEGYTLPEVAEQTASSLTTVKRWIARVDKAVGRIDAA